MFGQLSNSARRAMVNAEKAARRLNHEYVGTEHILLGLIEDETGAMARALADLGATTGQIRQEIERMVAAGSGPVPQRRLPLTPRAEQALAFAEEDARFLQQDRFGPEHLLFGLMREADGVAGQVLRELGLEPTSLGERLFAHRLNQLKFIERIVRPVRCTTLRKRKMREELLAHLTAIYDEEFARGNDADAAWQSAVERFGAPTELTCELQTALPRNERLSYLIESRIGWRAPESAMRWMVRSALQTAALLAALNVLAAIWMIAAMGWNPGTWMVIRAIGTMSLVIPLVQFVLGTLYFKVRDATFGVFGASKSSLRAVLLASLVGLTCFLTGLSFAPLGYGGAVSLVDVFVLAAAGLTTTLFFLLLVRQNGPDEIRDTLWASLDIDDPLLRNSPPAEHAG